MFLVLWQTHPEYLPKIIASGFPLAVFICVFFRLRDCDRMAFRYDSSHTVGV